MGLVLVQLVFFGQVLDFFRYPLRLLPAPRVLLLSPRDEELLEPVGLFPDFVSFVESAGGGLESHRCVLPGSGHGGCDELFDVVVLCELGAMNSLVGTASSGVAACGSGEDIATVGELDLMLVLELQLKLQEVGQHVIEALIDTEDGLCGRIGVSQDQALVIGRKQRPMEVDGGLKGRNTQFSALQDVNPGVFGLCFRELTLRVVGV